MHKRWQDGEWKDFRTRQEFSKIFLYSSFFLCFHLSLWVRRHMICTQTCAKYVDRSDHSMTSLKVMEIITIELSRVGQFRIEIRGPCLPQRVCQGQMWYGQMPASSFSAFYAPPLQNDCYSLTYNCFFIIFVFNCTLVLKLVWQHITTKQMVVKIKLIKGFAAPSSRTTNWT